MVGNEGDRQNRDLDEVTLSISIRWPSGCIVCILASRDANYMTGQAVNVDGGLVMGN